MSDLAVSNGQDPTPAQLELIKSTVAKGATTDELKLFLYRCRHMGLDPLKPGQIHFVKYGSSPGTIIIGIEGFRVRAAKTGKHAGTKRGVIRNNEDRCIGAWCEVYRSDWSQPAREEVSLSEYNTGKAQWSKMPETMIKKVAECAALRMAFPDELGGVYGKEEMDQAESSQTNSHSLQAENKQASPNPSLPDNPWDYRLPKHWKVNGGVRLRELGTDGVLKILKWIQTVNQPNDQLKEIYKMGDLALKTSEAKPKPKQTEEDWQNASFDDEFDRALAQRMEDPRS